MMAPRPIKARVAALAWRWDGVAIKELTQTVEKQTIDIQELKKLVEGANTTKTAPKPAKESRTMASHLAAVVAASPFSPSVLSSSPSSSKASTV